MLLRRFLLCCALLSLSFSLFANKDSLWTVWLDETKPDTSRIAAIYKLSANYYENPDSAITLAEQALEFAKKTNNKVWEIKSHSRLGVYYGNKGAVEESFKHLRLGRSLALARGDSIRAANLTFNIVAQDLNRGNYDKVIQPLDSLRQFFLVRKKYKNLNRSLFGLGTAYHGKGDYPKALSFYQQCADILENNDFDKSQVNEPYLHIGLIYFELNELEIAETFFDKSIDFNEKFAVNKGGLILGLTRKGKIYKKKRNRAMAKEYFQRGLDIANEYPDFEYFKVGPFSNMAVIALEDKDPKAILYINKLIKIEQKYGAANNLAQAMTYKGQYFLNLQQPEKTKFWCEQSLKKLEELNDLHLMSDACNCLYKAFKQLGNTQKSLFYHEKMSEYNDSLVSEKTVRKITQAEMQYSFDKQQLQDSLTNQQQLLLIEKDKAVLTAQNQNYLIASFGAGLLALTLLGFFLNVRSKNQQITQQKSDLEKLNTTKDRLFTIISHDLRKPALAFRGISKKVKFLIQQQEFETLDEYGTSLEKAAYSLNGLLDNLLNWALQQGDILPYNPAPINVGDVGQDIYDLFHQMAADKKISLKMNIPESTIIFADLNAYTTIIRNLIDNAIKYTPEGGIIDLSAEKAAEKIAIKVTDTGIGIPSEKIKLLFDLHQNKSSLGTAGEMGTGLGLTLVKDLVALNKGTIKVESEVTKGTTFEVLLPAA